MSTASKDTLGALHALIAKELSERIENGTASAADISNAIKFLKDNGIEARPDLNKAVKSLAEKFNLPSFNDEDGETPVH